jgi:hypothetical protein
MVTAARSEPARGAWLAALRWYLPLTFAANLVWETAQLPLYTLWGEGSAKEIAFAVGHCTGGDVVIALSALVLALVTLGEAGWPEAGFTRVAITATVLAAAYTVVSEWFNTTVPQSWAYTKAMPTLPPLGTGLAPLLQWSVIPPLCLLAVRHQVGTAGVRKGPGP